MKYTDLYPIIGAKCYFAVRRGSKIQAINYALKDLNGIEFGTLTGKVNVLILNRLGLILKMENLKKILPKEDFGQWCRNYKAFALYASMVEKHEARQCEIEVIYGPPGTGKSTLAMTRYPTLIVSSLDHQYWDGYQKSRRDYN